MKNVLIAVILLIIILIPGLLSFVFLWGIIFPKHRNFILTKLKGETNMALEKIHGRQRFDDIEIVKNLDVNKKTNMLGALDEIRTKAVNNACKYVDSKIQERAIKIGAIGVVGCFSLGALFVGSIWFVFTYIPFK